MEVPFRLICFGGGFNQLAAGRSIRKLYFEGACFAETHFDGGFLAGVSFGCVPPMSTSGTLHFRVPYLADKYLQGTFSFFSGVYIGTQFMEVIFVEGRLCPLSWCIPHLRASFRLLDMSVNSSHHCSA